LRLVSSAEYVRQQEEEEEEEEEMSCG